MTQEQVPVVEAVALSLTVPERQADALAAALWSLEPDGIEQQDAGTFGDIQETGASRLVLYVGVERATEVLEAAAGISLAMGLGTDWTRRNIEAQDWNAAWKAHYEPVEIGPRLLVIPAWQTAEPQSDRLIVRIDPGQAFGTGTHETTQLVAILLQRHIQQGDAVFDIGTGSALLAISAVGLGATRAVGVDNDGVAIASAQDNVALNGVQDRVVLHTAERPSAIGAGRFPLVMANIISSVLLHLRDDIVDSVQPGGLLLLSGVMNTEESGFLQRFLPQGWEVVDRVVRAEWIAVAVRAAT